jgi:putative transcriptional regulator
MSKLGKRLIEAAREGVAIARGEADPTTYRVHVPAEVNVRDIRHQLDLTQDEFAARFGLSVASIREWEQDRRRPEGPARVLLTVIQRAPAAVSQALAASVMKAPASAAPPKHGRRPAAAQPRAAERKQPKQAKPRTRA